MPELTTSFRLAGKAGACKDSYKRFAKAVGGIKAYGQDTPIPLVKVLDVLGLYDALWCLRAVPPEQEAERDKLTRLLACDYAEGDSGNVLAIYEKQYPGDSRPRDCIAVSRRYAIGQATALELVAAQDAALDAAWAARDAARVARDAGTARDAGAARAVALDAARGANEWQEAKFREYFARKEGPDG